MKERNVATIINFIRAIEPREEIDLLETVERQISLIQKHGLKATWLLQYDALIDERFVRLLRERLNERQEIGIWFETVQPLVEGAGGTWRGRYSWDWHCHVGYSIGYLPEERERMADLFMARFKDTFGAYPRSVGCWVLDAHLLRYLHESYGIQGACICKDQWGTDGITQWGGYFNQAYYPSRVNAFMPAQHPDEQITVPVFRMLGSDPIYQYDFQMEVGEATVHQGVVSLEPVYADGGGNPDWVRWFFRQNYVNPSLSFGYAQVGQENSFGWPLMEHGLTDQVQWLAKEGPGMDVAVETLAEAAMSFTQAYSATPASAVCALEDWKGEGRASIWYCSRFYRVNLFWDKGMLHIRDLHLFDERYRERYLADVCKGKTSIYDTLPLFEGVLWNKPGEAATFGPVHASSGEGLIGGKPDVTERKGTDALHIQWPLTGGGVMAIDCTPDALSIRCEEVPWLLRMKWPAGQSVPMRDSNGQSVSYVHEGYAYSLACEAGTVQWVKADAAQLVCTPERNEVRLLLNANGREENEA